MTTSRDGFEAWCLEHKCRPADLSGGGDYGGNGAIAAAWAAWQAAQLASTAELDAMRADRDSWEQQAFDRTKDALDLMAAERERCSKRIARVIDALHSLDARLKECMNHPISASEAYDSFYREIVSETLKEFDEGQK